MCKFFSGIVLEDPTSDIITSDYTDSHELLLRSAGIRDGHAQRGRFVRVELLPPEDHAKIGDVESWTLRTDDDDPLEWWTAERQEDCARRMRARVARMLLPDGRDCLIEGCWIVLGGKVDSAAGSARLALVLGSAKVERVYDSAQVGSVGDSAQVGIVYDSARVGSVGDSARVGSVGDSARVGSVVGSAKVERVCDSARVERVYDSARVGSVGDSARVGSVYDSAKVERVCGSAQVGIVGGSAKVGSVYDSAKVGSVVGSAQIVNDYRMK
jgi:hypothetical protein